MGAVSEQAAAKIAAKAEAAANEPENYPVEATEGKAIDRPAPETEVEAKVAEA
jgi:hypothetical protein